MTAFVVQFVYWDEPTPRTLHTRTVEAVDKHDANQIAVTEAALVGDRIGVTDINQARDAQ